MRKITYAHYTKNFIAIFALPKRLPTFATLDRRYIQLDRRCICAGKAIPAKQPWTLNLLPCISFLLKSSEGVLRPVARCYPWFCSHFIYTQFFSFFKNPLESRSVTGSSSRPLFMRQRSISDKACAKSSRVRLKAYINNSKADAGWMSPHRIAPCEI